jgi:hypothetical protein
MSLTRKRKKELRKLRGSAEDLWQDQQGVLDRASGVFKEASRQATLLAQEEVVPRVRTTYDARFKPSVDKGFVVGRAVASTAREKVVDDIIPAAAAVVGSALSVLELTKDVRSKIGESAGERVAKVSKKVAKTAAAAKIAKALGKHAPVAQKTGPGAGTIVLIVVGVLTLAGVAYAAWQTFRADDDLWVADDEPEVTGTDTPPGTTPSPTV